MYQVDQFSAIITPPQAAILAVGGIADKVVAVKGQIEVRPRMTLTISCDHRVADGARAAQFSTASPKPCKSRRNFYNRSSRVVLGARNA